MGRELRMLDPHRLRQFVAVAEHLNITRAAAELHLTQQAVSSTIKTIERDLGVSLLKRTGRRIELTDAGRILRDGALPLLDASSALVRAARDVGNADHERLVVAHTLTISVDDVFDLVEPVRREVPAASITARQLFADEITSALRSGQVDIALRRGVATPNGVAGSTIGYSALRVAVSTSHPLAFERAVTLGDMAQTDLILSDPPGASFYSDFVVAACRRRGFEPSVVINRIRGMPPTTAVIGTGKFAFVTADPGSYHHGEVVVLELEEAPRLPIQALWLQHTRSRLRQIMVGGNRNLDWPA